MLELYYWQLSMVGIPQVFQKYVLEVLNTRPLATSSEDLFTVKGMMISWTIVTFSLLIQHYTTIRYDTIRYDTIQYDTIRFITTIYNTIRHDTTRLYSIPFHSIRYDTIRYDNYFKSNCLFYISESYSNII